MPQGSARIRRIPHRKAGTGQGCRSCPGIFRWETDMLKGGLLWLIGIPLPIIILIALFTNWL
jgi:hypothetical protein